MSRAILAESQIHTSIQSKVSSLYKEVVEEAKEAIENHEVVVVGMAQNPYSKKAQKLLKKRGIPFKYLEYGSYLSMWRKRSSLKMWTGWPTFPMVFVKGSLVGGASDLEALLEAGSLELQGQG